MTPPEPSNFASPLKINCGEQALDHLPFELGCRRLRVPLILGNRDAIGEKRIAQVVAAFQSAGMDAGCFDRLPERREDDLLPLLDRMYHDGGCDCIVAVGAGSVVDTAKCLNLFVSRIVLTGESEREIGPLRPLMLVPTPGGDGYEATGLAIDGKRRLLATPLVPRLAVIDPVMMDGDADGDLVAGGMIGFVHAVEAYLDERSAPVAKAYGHAAIDLIARHLPDALDGERRTRRRCRAAVVNGQIAAACAFPAAAPGLCHRVAHSLNGDGSLPVGMLMATLLPHFVEVAGDIAPDLVGGLLTPLARPEIQACIADDLRVPRIIAFLWEWFHAINARLEAPIPRSLEDAGIDEKRIHAFLKQAGGDASDPVVRMMAGARRDASGAFG